MTPAAIALPPSPARAGDGTWRSPPALVPSAVASAGPPAAGDGAPSPPPPPVAPELRYSHEEPASLLRELSALPARPPAPTTESPPQPARAACPSGGTPLGGPSRPFTP